MDNFNFAELLRRHREQNDYSVREMADILHMSKSAYDRLERGLTKPTYEQIQRILKLLDLKPDAIGETDTGGKPMPAIRYLKRGLLYGSILLDEALGCLKDLAEAVECQPLLEWTELEIKGYWKQREKVPAYRLGGLRCEVAYEQGDDFHKNLILPNELIDPDKIHPLRFAYFSTIEEWDQRWPANDFKSFSFEDRLIPDLEPVLQKIYGPDLKLLAVMWSVSDRFKRKVILAVQEVMLRFLQELETQFGPNAGSQELKMNKHFLATMFRKALNEVGRADHLDLPIKFIPPEKVILSKGDDEAFANWLLQHDVWDDEMEEFFKLLDMLDEAPPPEGIVPPEMYAWAKKLTSKNKRFWKDGEKLIEGLKVFYGVEG